MFDDAAPPPADEGDEPGRDDPGGLGGLGNLDEGCSGVRLWELRLRAREVQENLWLIEDHAPDALEAIRGHLDGLSALLGELDLGCLGDDSLMGTALAVEEARRKLDAINAKVLARVDASGITETAVGLKVKGWKSNRTHGSPSSVARELKVAHTIERFEAFGEALANGDVSADHVVAISNACRGGRITDELVAIEDSLVSYARRHQYPVFVRHLTHLVALLDQDGAEPDCGDRDTAAMGHDLEGHLHLRLELSGHNAIEAERIINEEADRQYRAAVREHEATGRRVPDPAVLRARAVMELLRRGAKSNPSSSTPATEAILPVVVDRDGRPVAVHSIDGQQLDPVTTAVLLCDAHLQPVVVDTSGNPLNLGRTVRYFTAAQRNALVVRDGGCIFPGCDQPAERCDAHHELAWESGGATDIDNGSLLCRRHHGMVHRHDPWRIEHLDIHDLPPDLLEAHLARAATARVEPTQQVRVWRTPSGRLLLAQNAIDHNGPAPPRGP